MMTKSHHRKSDDYSASREIPTSHWSRIFITVFTKARPGFYDEESLALLPTSKLEDHPISAVRDCLFSTFAATLHIWKPSSPVTTRGRARLLWQGST